MNGTIPIPSDPIGRAKTATRRTPRVLAGAARRRDAVLVFVLTALAYLLAYQWAVQNLFFGLEYGLGVEIVDQPFERMVQSGRGAYGYEAVATVDLAAARLLFSPLDLTIGGGIALLVGVNLGLSYLAVAQPRSCGIGTTSGLLASVPALLTGGTCCAPVLLLVLGITASGTLLTVISWLLPVGVLLLVGSLVYLAGRISPTAFEG